MRTTQDPKRLNVGPDGEMHLLMGDDRSRNIFLTTSEDVPAPAPEQPVAERQVAARAVSDVRRHGGVPPRRLQRESEFRRRPAQSVAASDMPRPDRVAMFAVLMGLFLAVVAAATGTS